MKKISFRLNYVVITGLIKQSILTQKVYVKFS
jgi:hypothetical protein